MPGVSTAPDPGARRSLRARFRSGPIGRRIAAFDVRYYGLLRVPPRYEEPLARFSRCGEHAACWVALGGAGIALDRRRRDEWRRSLVAVAAAYVLNTLLKNVVRRKRPIIEGMPQLIKTPTKLSFPSAHSSSSFAAARAYSALVPAAPLYALASGMAVSRVSLGVHYPSDILVGAGLGTLVGSLGR